MARPIVQAVSNTFLDTAQRCDRKLKFRYIDKIQRRVKSDKPERGTWVHALLETYYKALQAGKPQEVAVKYAEARHKKYRQEFWDELFEEEQEELGPDFPDVCWGIFERYVAHYADETKRWRKILIVEKYIEVPVDWLPVPFGIKCDLVVLDDLGWVQAFDHKIVGSIPNEDERMIDTQGPRYILGLQEFFAQRGLKPKGVMVTYNYIRDRLPAKPELTKTGAISKKWIDTDVETFIEAVKELGGDPADYQDMIDRIAVEGKPFFDRWQVPRSDVRLQETKRDVQAITAEHVFPKDYYPRTLDRKKCSWDCEFLPLCMIELEGGSLDEELRKNFIVKEGSDDDTLDGSE